MHNQHDAAYDNTNFFVFKNSLTELAYYIPKRKKFSLAIYPEFKKETKKKEIICENRSILIFFVSKCCYLMSSCDFRYLQLPNA